MLHGDMGTVTVRVVPRSGRTSIDAGADGIVIRVRAVPEGGRATDEARRALAKAAGVPASAVRLRVGARTRTKVFDVRGVDGADLERRLRGG
jgi:uncharacterized protein YggU (UPF0235/DUF167 family)